MRRNKWSCNELNQLVLVYLTKWDQQGPWTFKKETHVTSWLYIYAAFCSRSCAAPLVRGVMEKEADRAKLDVSDLGVLLEKEEAIRTHLRDSENVLFAGETKESVKVACTAHINVLLRVVLTKVVETEGMPQPPIHPLRDQLELLYHKCGRVSVDTDQIIRDSWYVRKFVGLVKMKTRKEKVSEEPSLEFRNAYNLYLIRPFPCKWQYIFWFALDDVFMAISPQSSLSSFRFGIPLRRKTFRNCVWSSTQNWRTGGLYPGLIWGSGLRC